MNILEKFLKSRGIKSPEELSRDERKDFDNWQAIISKPELTTKDIQNFCLTQVSLIENKWKSYDTDTEKKAQLIPYHTVYRTLLQIIDSPQQERSNLEATLNQLI